MQRESEPAEAIVRPSEVGMPTKARAKIGRRPRGRSRPSEVERIATVIGSEPLAKAIYRSVGAALKRRSTHIGAGETVWSVFERSLNMAIRDIESHPRGQLLLRLIEYGTADPDDPELIDGHGKNILTD